MGKNGGKLKLPKKVAGVKVPKALRKSKALDALVASPMGREILAGAIVAAAGAAAAALRKHAPSLDEMERAGKKAADTAGDAASSATDLTRAAAGALAGVVADAAESFLRQPKDRSGKASSGQAKRNGERTRSGRPGPASA